MKIRSVRPEFFADPTMAELSHAARLLYVGLWCIADDDGRGEWLPKQIDGQVFPLESVDIHALLEQLVSSARVVRYTDGNRQYFYIPTFTEYQRPNRKYDSKLPDPADCQVLPSKPQDSLFEQRVRTADAHAVEVEVEVEGAAAASSFQVFHSTRARKEVDRRAAAGIPIKNRTGLAITIAGDDEFVAESRRIWGHRECSGCGGSGFVSVYAPGSGSRKVNCDRPLDNP